MSTATKPLILNKIFTSALVSHRCTSISIIADLGDRPISLIKKSIICFVLILTEDLTKEEKCGILFVSD